ncbi:hypothetical protein [Demequina lutea]|uniref:Uncharacterized protein n=1 Tax=Demequina lutea TaxID=431489 RepID=A0A7Y9ZE72_9MICO|nr:hypothetical protein [Demequina lutea]NYI42608.1 hypothetical protein [Demequina lutea]
MGYYINVWDGARPASSLEAAKIEQRLYREAHPRVEPTETLRDFVAALKREWPGLPGDPMAGTPWKYLPLEGEAAGSLFDTVLTFGSAATAVPRIARIAEERGLVFFDPQLPKLRVPFKAAWER